VYGRSPEKGPAYCCVGCAILATVAGQPGDAPGAETRRSRSLMLRLGLAAFFTADVMVLSLFLYSLEMPGVRVHTPASVLALMRGLALAFSVPVMVLLEPPFLKGLARDLRRGRFSLDSLIAIGAGAAFLHSAVAVLEGRATVYFDTATMLLLVVTAGRLLEANARLEGKRALEGLVRLQPPQARVWRGEACLAPSRMERLADRAAAAFVPLTMALAALVTVYWQSAGPGRAWLIGLSVLVVACPCATGIAASLANVLALGAAARSGVLIRSTEALERLVGVRTVALDQIAEAAEVLAACRKLGLRLMLLSGDRTAAVEEAARRLDVADYAGELLPEDKVTRIRATQAQGQRVAMVGDGLNDALALAAADVGIAVSSGVEVTREVAQVAFLEGGVWKLPRLFELARRARRIAIQNLAWAFGYNAVALALASAGLLRPIWAALIMLASSVVVIANALRVRK